MSDQNIDVLEEINSALGGEDGDYTLNIEVLEAILEAIQNGGASSSGGSVTVDSALSLSSTNPVQNKVVSSQMFGMLSGILQNNKGSMELYAKDLDTITTSGFYNALQCTNTSFEYAHMIVIGYYLDGYCAQLQIDATTASMAFRVEVAGTWTNWKTVTAS